MPWNSTSPLGSVSVKDNRPIQQQNTTYIEVTMGNSIVGTNTNTTRDHFWNVGTNEDGRHRFIQSVGFTSNAVAPDNVYPVLGSGMQTVLFPLVTNGEVQWFHKNQVANTKIYQFIPNFLTGSIAVPTTSYTNLVAVPANVYGEIFMWTTALGSRSSQSGSFRSNGSIVEAWGFAQSTDSESSSTPLKFASGSDAVDLNIKVRRSDAGAAAWNYRITYRAQ
jgi:hypothetical protein